MWNRWEKLKQKNDKIETQSVKTISEIPSAAMATLEPGVTLWDASVLKEVWKNT